jgi:hypothetical protein
VCGQLPGSGWRLCPHPGAGASPAGQRCAKLGTFPNPCESHPAGKWPQSSSPAQPAAETRLFLRLQALTKSGARSLAGQMAAASLSLSFPAPHAGVVISSRPLFCLRFSELQSQDVRPVV